MYFEVMSCQACSSFYVDFATCQIARFDLSGEKRVIQNPSERMKSEIKVEEFKENEVYAVDVIMSTGDGKVRYHLVSQPYFSRH